MIATDIPEPTTSKPVPFGQHCWHPLGELGPKKGMVFGIPAFPDAEGCCRCSFARREKKVHVSSTANGHGVFLSENQDILLGTYEYYGPMNAIGPLYPTDHLAWKDEQPACNSPIP